MPADCGMPEESFEQVAGSVCLEVYRETLRGLVIACRRYKDELLEACLELLLSAPTPVMTIHVSFLAGSYMQLTVPHIANALFTVCV